MRQTIPGFGRKKKEDQNADARWKEQADHMVNIQESPSYTDNKYVLGKCHKTLL